MVRTWLQQQVAALEWIVNKSVKEGGFTLIEMVAVVAVLMILGFIIVTRVGNLRASAYDASARMLETEFSRGVEQLVSNAPDGAGVVGNLQLIASTGALISTVSGDPDYMGLASTVYRISSPTNVNAAAVSGALSQLNNLLAAGHCGCIRGSVDPGLLSFYNVDLVVVKDANGAASTVLLKLSRP